MGEVAIGTFAKEARGHCHASVGAQDRLRNPEALCNRVIRDCIGRQRNLVQYSEMSEPLEAVVLLLLYV